jgi:drug/metabolite transporter (DMT)-like permease
VKLSRGVLYMAVSAAGFSVMSVLVKLASERLPMGEIVLARAVVTLVLSYAMVRHARLPVWGTQRGRLVFRGLLGFGGLAGYYAALGRLPLADATTLQKTTPLLIAGLAWWLLGERVGWATFVAIGCGLVGVVLVAHPTLGEPLDPLGVAFALGGATCTAIAYVTVRQLARTEHPLVIVFFFPLVAAPLAIPWALADFAAPTPSDLVLLLAIGVATQVAQVCLTIGLSLERAGRAASVGYLEVCFAMVWQLVIFGVHPALTTIAGATLIIAGTLVTAGSPSRTPTPPA